MSSEVAPTTDIAQCSRHVSNLHRTGLMQRSKKRCLLDHLVGALTSVTGTVSPSAFAVLRLSDNSNLEA
jgi:hypothetical protein